MKRMHWLVGITAAVAVFAAGCGGAAEKPGAPTNQNGTPAASSPDATEGSKTVGLTFEVIKDSVLPQELHRWKELTEPPKSTGSARVGDYLYILVTGGMDSIGASAIAVKQVELVQEPTPIITVTAMISPGKTGAEIMTFPTSYIRIPYAASLPVPGVLTNIQRETVKGDSAPVTNPPVDPNTPVSSPKNTDTTVTSPETSAGDLAVTPIPASALPSSLSAWKGSTVNGPNGIARHVDGTLYLMVSGGERNSGGYSVEIKSVEGKDRTLYVSAVLHSPKPGQLVTEAITYPRAYATVNLPGSGEPEVIVNWR